MSELRDTRVKRFRSSLEFFIDLLSGPELSMLAFVKLLDTVVSEGTAAPRATTEWVDAGETIHTCCDAVLRPGLH
ncbi:hypothetical protein [Natronosalvus amylolyticus]|uniref:hypothetical protein n=1 Tax=Natronosalvus amylolyticus TaxID=2961994 RepID=UPI0020CA0281|nr:hypothetical protein [Natronosalvus amylolyticus]